MRKILFALLLAGPASAQTPAAPQKPVDVGPFTGDANRAYQGGGVVLQGAPNAPAPTPKPTPPGEAPAGSVTK